MGLFYNYSLLSLHNTLIFWFKFLNSVPVPIQDSYGNIIGYELKRNVDIYSQGSNANYEHNRWSLEQGDVNI